MVLRDVVFQDIVWGPQLWNAFFCDARKAVQEKGFTEKVYADDLNAYKAFPVNTPNEDLLAEAAVAGELLRDAVRIAVQYSGDE